MERAPAYILAFCENKCREVGVAVVAIHTATAVVSQFTDTHSYVRALSFLQKYHPDTVLLPISEKDSPLANALQQCLEDEHAPIFLHRSEFREDDGVRHFKRLALPSDAAAETALSIKYLAMASLCAAINHVESYLKVTYVTNGLHITLTPDQDLLEIDWVTARSLCLVEHDKKNKGNSLFSIMDRCKTKEGKRLLRGNLLAPPSNANTTQQRLQCVEELLESNDSNILFALEASLNDMLGLGNSIVHFTTKKPGAPSISKIKSLTVASLSLAKSLRVVDRMVSALLPCTSPLFVAIRNRLQSTDLGEVKNILAEIVDEDAIASFHGKITHEQEITAIKMGRNEALDTARRVYGEVNADIEALLLSYADTQTHPPFKVMYAKARGYFIKTKESPHVDAVRVQRKKNTTSYSTPELERHNARLLQSLGEIQNETGAELLDLVERLKPFLGALHATNEAVSMLDMLQSFASYAALCTGSTSKPTLATHAPLKIVKGRHPILNQQPGVSCLPNSTILHDGANVKLLTGENGCGKTTYLHQAALLSIMAHIGCYVPATHMETPPLKQIATRMSAGDSIEENRSSFGTEMMETSYMLHTAREGCLYLIDELGQSTGSNDGLAISWAVVEALAAKNSFVIMATHYHRLTHLPQYLPNVENIHLTVTKLANNGIKYNRTIASGPCPQHSLHEIEQLIVNFPTHIQEQIMGIATQISKRVPPMPKQENYQQRYAKVKLGFLLHQLMQSNLSNSALRSCLKRIRSTMGPARSLRR